MTCSPAVRSLPDACTGPTRTVDGCFFFRARRGTAFASTSGLHPCMKSPVREWPGHWNGAAAGAEPSWPQTRVGTPASLSAGLCSALPFCSLGSLCAGLFDTTEASCSLPAFAKSRIGQHRRRQRDGAVGHVVAAAYAASPRRRRCGVRGGDVSRAFAAAAPPPPTAPQVPQPDGAARRQELTRKVDGASFRKKKQDAHRVVRH